MPNNTETLAIAFDTSDRKLSEIEDEKANIEEDVKTITQELSLLTKELEKLASSETRQIAEVDKAYAAWAEEVDALPDDEEYFEIEITSEYSGKNYA